MCNLWENNHASICLFSVKIIPLKCKLINVMELIIKKPRERSKEYPQFDLKTCLDLTETINSKLGNRISTLEQIANTINNSEARASSKLSACRQFGLVELVKKEGYKPTELFFKVTRGRTDQDKKDALLKCIQSPTIYGDFISKHNNEEIPSDLASIFYWDYKITENAKDEAASVFRTCLDQCGFIVDGKLNTGVAVADPGSEESQDETKDKLKLEGKGDGNTPPPIKDEKPKLPSGRKSTDLKVGAGEFITVIYPENITNDQIERAIKQLELWKD